MPGVSYARQPGTNDEEDSEDDDDDLRENKSSEMEVDASEYQASLDQKDAMTDEPSNIVKDVQEDEWIVVSSRRNRVSRISARSEQFEMLMHLDINVEIYPMYAGDKFMMVLASTLNLDGTPDTGYFTPGNKKSLADKFDYVMQGKLYRISEETREKQVKADMYVSFGGLLMMLKGDPSIAARFELDQKLFILIRKV
ncbi:hypothetical protein RD792_000215 [Penstemon davidsonii]|uniref:Uncharacterized protein n=1 Tax=Penstemon davidsonii TaxID=160366 RepID=A0ABR0DUL0_9LAMI|nr:hypothetical protein RD792_000215 [Penstemon davidsonii]